MMMMRVVVLIVSICSTARRRLPGSFQNSRSEPEIGETHRIGS